MRTTSTSDITALSAREQVSLLATGELAAVDAVQAHIARIEAVNPNLNAVVIPLFHDARERARIADQIPADKRRPLHGLPVTVKECLDVAGTPSTAGLPGRAGPRATLDAPLVARLREAGAIILGKTNLSQLLMYVESDNPVYGRANNPWDLQRSPGGSSGGEAAIVAAGGSALGLGTDAGGSVRIPAHCCGIHSLKPTPGRLPTDGMVQVVGPLAAASVPDSGGLLARHVGDLRLGLDVLSPTTPSAPTAGRLRVGVYEDDGYFPASAALRRAVAEAATRLTNRGFDVVAFRPPDVPDGLDIFYGLFGADRGARWRTLLSGSTVDPRMKDLLALAAAPDRLRPVISIMLRIQGQPRLARTVRTVGGRTESEATELVRRRNEYRDRFAAAMSEARVDTIICPPCSVPAFTHGSTKDLGPASVNYTCLYNLLAYPAGVVTTTRVKEEETTGRPVNREKMQAAARLVDQGSAGLPVGVQVVASPGREDQVLAVMEVLEEAAGPLPRPIP